MSDLLKDAARYRWIANLGSCPYAETDEAWESPVKLNAAIDADIELASPISAEKRTQHGDHWSR